MLYYALSVFKLNLTLLLQKITSLPKRYLAENEMNLIEKLPKAICVFLDTVNF